MRENFFQVQTELKNSFYILCSIICSASLILGLDLLKLYLISERELQWVKYIPINKYNANYKYYFIIEGTGKL